MHPSSLRSGVTRLPWASRPRGAGSVRRRECVPPGSVGEVADVDSMRVALAQAERGLEAGAMPIGAVLVHGAEILAEAHWKGAGYGLLAHPEHTVLVTADALVPFEARREATLYTTLEPCLMCVGTAMSFCLGRIVYPLAARADGVARVMRQWCP